MAQSGAAGRRTVAVRSPRDRAGTAAVGRAVWTAVRIAVLAGTVFWVLYRARSVLLLVYASALLAIGFSPVVRAIERRPLWPAARWRPPRALAILALYVVALGTVAGLAALLVPPLIAQASALAADAPAMLDRARGALAGWGLPVPSISELSSNASDRGAVVGAAVGTVWSVFGGIAGLVTILVLTFYFLVDARDLFDAGLRVVPRERRPQVRDVAERIVEKVSGWLLGQLMLAGIIGATTALGLGLIGVPYFWVLAIVAAVGEVIPYVGPLIAAVPGVAVAATQGWTIALWTGLFYLAQQQLENHVITPKLMSQQVGLIAAVVVLAIVVGGAAFGVAGAILALPTAGIIQVVVQEVLADDAAA
jgi:predicted PurR-regulated permease PerM